MTPMVKEKKWSTYQDAGFAAVLDTHSNLFAEAVAGSGKTTFIVEVCNRLPKNLKSAFCAFNKAIAQELVNKLPKHVEAKTLHSMGFGAIRDNLGKAVHMEETKTALLLSDVIKEDSDEYKASVAFYARLIGLAKNNLLISPVSKDTWQNLINEYGLTLPESGFSIETLNTVFDRSSDKSCKRNLFNKFFRKIVELPLIDFDDMLYYPAKYNWNCGKGLDVLCVDEAQDLNAAQSAMLETANKNGTRIIAVGDEKQAIYGFRGANSKSISELINKFSMKKVPLSITYRCSKSVVKLAQTLVPQIEAREGAPEGKVESLALANFMQNPAERCNHGDVVICRTNAPLVVLAFALLKSNSGKKFRIQGVELGQELSRLVGYLTYKNKLSDTDIEGFNQALASYESDMIKKYSEIKNNGQRYIEEMQDKLSVIQIASANSQSISGIKVALLRLFADTKDRNCILLSTIHRAKGLEVVAEDNTCFILKTELLPHPRATQDWELEQERNLQYVAYTRAKSNLTLIFGEKK
jgi:DNA helicase-2/ATP-dependent DNA helicase PcrA